MKIDKIRTVPISVMNLKIGKRIEASFSLNEWKKARQLILKELGKTPTDHWLLTRLSSTFYEERNYRKALEINKKARKIAPQCPLVLWDYACSLDMVGKNKNAIAVWKQLLRLGVNKIAYNECGEGIRWSRSLLNDCRYRIGISFYKIGNLPVAIKYIQNYVANRKKGIRSIFHLSIVKNELAEIKKRKK